MVATGRSSEPVGRISPLLGEAAAEYWYGTLKAGGCGVAEGACVKADVCGWIAGSCTDEDCVVTSDSARDRDAGLAKFPSGPRT